MFNSFRSAAPLVPDPAENQSPHRNPDRMDHPVSDARICTIGHSNRPIDEFIALLR